MEISNSLSSIFMVNTLCHMYMFFKTKDEYFKKWIATDAVHEYNCNASE